MINRVQKQDIKQAGFFKRLQNIQIICNKISEGKKEKM